MPKQGEFSTGDPPPQMEPDKDGGVVTFLRESAFAGGGISYYVYEDGRKIGALKSGTWFMHKATPGKHTYMAETEAKDILTLTVEPEKRYYIVGGIAVGMWAGRPQLKEATEAYAKPLLAGLDYISFSYNFVAAQ